MKIHAAALRTGMGLLLLVGVCTSALVARPARAAVVTLKNGMRIEGALGKIAGLAENPLKPANPAGPVEVRLIVLVDDGLRRTFFSTYQVQDLATAEGTAAQPIRISQRVATNGHRIAGLGPILRIEPIDQYGRRSISLNTMRGPVDVIQGITEITPVWTKLEGLVTASPYIWDMRIATSSIPRETLSKVLMNAGNRTNSDMRLGILRLYIESERYQDARMELEGILKDFPELRELEQQVSRLRQLGAQRLIQEIKLRRDAGQHLLAYQMLSSFPSEGVAGETLLEVRELLEKYNGLRQQGERVLALMSDHLASLKDPAVRQRLEPIHQEISTELNITTLDRMADYLRLADDDKLEAEQKLSLAISGWLLGSGAGIENLPVAVSLARVRDLIRAYLSTSRASERADVLQELASLEGGTPSYVAKLLAAMKPPVEMAPQEGPIPGLLKLSVPGLTGGADITYHVQLPPEYDPYRRYPVILTLNGAGTTPLKQVDWWAGAFSEESKLRLGQASRRGYIVVAPEWTAEHQRTYGYSAQEHAAVLYCLRDACRRFSVDTDRVYLSGHSIGGDAVWDIALAHPDLWAGVIPVVATADKYVARYWENGAYVSFYFVGGELDGDRMSRNATDLDRYLKKPNFDTTVVEYLGRGHEHFSDEIQRIFTWMELHRRNFFPAEFTVNTMRAWDNFFWWAELEDYPVRSIVVPTRFDTQAGARPVVTEGRIVPSANRVSLNTGAGKATVWLSPEMVDFQQRVSVDTGRTRSKSLLITPSVETILEDVRTRGDRLHPFWAKVEM